MENPDLPQDIILEIFSRLPAKTVGKCRTLSKYYKAHLSTKSFIKKHLITRQQTIQQENIAIHTLGCQVWIVTSPTRNDEVKKNRGGVFNKWSQVIGSCNGLILFKTKLSEHLLLANPITLKQVTIPLTGKPYYIDCYALGYDSCADDYKVVKLAADFKSSYTILVYVYSVKSGVWKRVDSCYHCVQICPSIYGGVFVNGALHWLICNDDHFTGSQLHSCIAVFDLANEVFREIPVPYGFFRNPEGLSFVGGCLVIVDKLGSGDTDIWMMKEYGVASSWVRFHIKCSIDATLCYVENGELLVLTHWDYLFACDLEKGTVRKVVLGDCDARFAHGMTFVDSLISPEGSL